MAARKAEFGAGNVRAHLKEYKRLRPQGRDGLVVTRGPSGHRLRIDGGVVLHGDTPEEIAAKLDAWLIERDRIQAERDAKNKALSEKSQQWEAEKRRRVKEMSGQDGDRFALEIVPGLKLWVSLGSDGWEIDAGYGIPDEQVRALVALAAQQLNGGGR